MTFFTAKSKFGTSETHRKQIRTRAQMPDGSILQGRAGQKVIDERRRARDKAMKYEVKQ